MSVRHFMHDASDVRVEVTSRVISATNRSSDSPWQAHEQAEEAACPMIEIVLQDPAMDLTVVGKHRYYIVEDESDSDDQVIFNGYIDNFEVSRGENDQFEPVARIYTLQIADTNTLFTRRVMHTSGSSRPPETDVARMAWYADTSEASVFNDGDTYRSTASPVAMDKSPYRGQPSNQVVADCADAGKKNYWAQVQGNLSSFFTSYMWYGKDALSSYVSPLTFSNDPADWTDSELADGTSTVWPIFEDAKERSDWSRVVSGGYGTYDNGALYRNREDTADFLGGHIDGSFVWMNVKTAAKASARMTATLNDLDSPDLRVRWTTRLPKNKVTSIRAGMRTQIKATHLPDISDFTDVRVVECIVQPVQNGRYFDVTLEAVVLSATVAPSCSALAENSATDYQNPSGSSTTGATISISEDVTLDSTDPHVVLAVGMVTMAGTPHASDVAGTGDFTTLHSGDADALDPVGATIYATGQTSSPVTVTAQYTTGYQGHGNWGLAAVSFQSSDVAPVQAKDTTFNVGGSGVLAFDSPPTIGNVVFICGWMRSRSIVPDSAHITPSGSCPIASFTQEEHFSIGGRTDCAFIAARVIDGTEANSFGVPLAGNQWHLSISEWTIDGAIGGGTGGSNAGAYAS